MKKFLVLCVIFLFAAVCASPAAAYSTLVQFDPLATNDSLYPITGISEFDWQSSGSAVSENLIVDSSVTGAITYQDFLDGASSGDWVKLTIHAQARLNGFIDEFGAGIDDTHGLSIDGGDTGSYEVTTTLDIVETAIYYNLGGIDTLQFVSATGTFAYYLDDDPDSVVISGAGFNDGGTVGLTPFLWGTVSSVNPTTFSATGSGSSFLNNTILGYDATVIETDPLSNSPLVGSTFDTTLQFFHSGDKIQVGGTIGGGPYPAPTGPIASYTVLANDLILNVDSNSEFAAGVIPEPGTMVLFGFGLLSLAGAARRKRA